MPENDSICLMQQEGDSEVAATRVALCEHLALYTLHSTLNLNLILI